MMVEEREPALILAYSLRRRNRCFRVWSIGAPYVCEWFRGSMRECFGEILLIGAGSVDSMGELFDAVFLPLAFFHQSRSQ